MDASTKKCGMEYSNNNIMMNRSEASNFIDFSAPTVIYHEEKKPVINHIMNNGIGTNQLHVSQMNSMSMATSHPSSMDSLISSFSSYQDDHDQNDQLFTCADWDELRAVVEFASTLDPDLV